MAKTYTFPTQRVLSGVLSFEVVTSTGSGSSTETEKYFSDEITRNNETEFLAGDLKSTNLDFTIAYDKDDLFRSTILPVALTDGEFVTVKVLLDGAVKFIGKIEPLTISNTTFYADNDNLGGQKAAIQFRCTSLLGLLNLITKDTLVSAIDTYVVSNGRYITIAEGFPVVTTNYYYLSTRELLNIIFSLFGSTFGYSYSTTYSLTDWTFYSKGDGMLNSSYIYPNTGARGDVNFSKFGGSVEPSLIFGTMLIGAGEPMDERTYVGLFATDDKTFITAYDYFAGFIKSFGIYCDVQHSPSVDLILTIGARSSGLPIETVDVLTANETPMSEIARRKINVDSLQSGNSYVKDYGNIGTSEYSSQVAFDFGNDLDFPGGSDPVNSVKSLVIPDTTHFQLARYIGIGEGYLLNPNLDANIDSWTAGGSWVFDGSSPFAFGSARATLDTFSYQELYQTLPEQINDSFIFGGKFRANDTNNSVRISFYSYFSLLQEEDFWINSADTDVMLYSVVPRNKFLPITRVSVSVAAINETNPSGYVWFGYSFLQRARKGTPQLIGLQIEDLFNDGNLSRQSRTLNGIQDIKPSDYYTYNGEKFYIKRVNWQMKNHETEIEAINYPY